MYRADLSIDQNRRRINGQEDQEGSLSQVVDRIMNSAQMKTEEQDSIESEGTQAMREDGRAAGGIRWVEGNHGSHFVEIDFENGRPVMLSASHLEPRSFGPTSQASLVDKMEVWEAIEISGLSEDDVEDIISIFCQHEDNDRKKSVSFDVQPLETWSDSHSVPWHAQNDELEVGRVNMPLRRSSGDTKPDSKPRSTRFRSYQRVEWQSKYESLLRYLEVHGDCNVPQAYAKNPDLAMWVKRQRYQFGQKRAGKSSTLSDERERLLNDISFVWDYQQAQWEERLKELKAFSAETGHCNVPSQYPKNKSLAAWVKVQRRVYADRLTSTNTRPGFKNILDERIQKLNDLGFDWKRTK